MREDGAAVRWVGAQRDVLAGDLSGKIAIDALRDLPHVYGLGPLEGVRGEVSIFDGKPSVSRVVDGAIAVDGSFAHRACFLVYASVEEWIEVPAPGPISGFDEVEAAVLGAARHRGIDVGRPLPFLIDGRAEHLTLHILDKRDGLPHTPERHERAKAHFSFAGEPVRVLGFFSDGHRGVFTPKDANLHMHVKTEDGRASGHLDRIQLAPGASFWLPRERGGKD